VTKSSLRLKSVECSQCICEVILLCDFWDFSTETENGMQHVEIERQIDGKVYKFA